MPTFKTLSLAHTSKLDLIASIRLIQLKSELIIRATKDFKNSLRIKAIVAALNSKKAELIKNAVAALDKTLTASKLELGLDKLRRKEDKKASQRAELRASVIQEAIALNAIYDQMLDSASQQAFEEIKTELDSFIEVNKLDQTTVAKQFKENLTCVLQNTNGSIAVNLPEFKKLTFTASTLQHYQTAITHDLEIYQTDLVDGKLDITTLLHISIVQQLVIQLIKSAAQTIGLDKIEAKLTVSITAICANIDVFADINSFLECDYFFFLKISEALTQEKLKLNEQELQESTTINDSIAALEQQYSKVKTKHSHHISAMIKDIEDYRMVTETFLKNSASKISTQEQATQARLQVMIAEHLIRVTKNFHSIAKHFLQLSRQQFFELITNLSNLIRRTDVLSATELKAYLNFSFSTALKHLSSTTGEIVVDGYSKPSVPIAKPPLKALLTFFIEQFTDVNNAEASIRKQKDAEKQYQLQCEEILKLANSGLLYYYYSEHKKLPQKAEDLRASYIFLHEQYKAMQEDLEKLDKNMHSLVGNSVRAEKYKEIEDNYKCYSDFFYECTEPFNTEKMEGLLIRSGLLIQEKTPYAASLAQLGILQSTNPKSEIPDQTSHYDCNLDNNTKLKF